MEQILYITSMILCLVSGALSIFVPTKRLSILTLPVAAVVSAALLIALRWYESGHSPIFGTYEEVLAASFTLALAALITVKRAPLIASFCMFLAAATYLYGLTFSSAQRPLIISEQSLWVEFHVLFSWVAYAFSTLSFGAALMVLFGRSHSELTRVSGQVLGQLSREDGWSEESRLWAKNPVEWLLRDGLTLGVYFQGVFFFLGSYYSSRLHGNWWMWDPVEYLFVIAWLLYCVAVHGRLFLGWGKRKVACWTIAAFVVTMALYWGLYYISFSTYHVFDIGVKVHLFHR